MFTNKILKLLYVFTPKCKVSLSFELKYEIEFKKITGFGIPTLDEIQQLNQQ